jgi:hypothetical protein
VFEDEFGFSFAESLAPTWAPRGQTPRIKRVGRYRRETSTLAGLTLSGKLYHKHFGGAINSEKVIEGLAHLGRQIKGCWILVWDGSGTHTSKRTQAYLAEHPEIIVESMPAYAPEVNPEEHCHGNIKQRLRNATPSTVAEIRHNIDRSFARLRRRPDMLLGFIHLAGLVVKRLW